ncbi:MAG: hypothetical protein HN402_02280 [Candidatus Scalindua sp.]|nr:hypothetical protein [Candidatus Scalindua sp.]
MKNHFPLIFLLIAILIVISGCAEKPEKPETPETSVTLEAPEIPVQYRNFNYDFKQSVILLSKVRDLSNPPGSKNQIAFQVSKETEEKIISNSREGIRLGKLVSDEYLDSISPELRYMFKNKLIKGSEIFYDGFMASLKARAAGVLSKGEQKQIQGVQLQIEWIEWFGKKSKSFSHKVFEN